MKSIRLSLPSACLLFFCAALSTLASPLILVPVGSTWKYSADGTDWGTAWRGVGFDDSAWLSGSAQLGYGDGDEVTVVTTPPERPATVYFRKGVLIPSGVAVASVRLLRDDGAVVYVNGVEVLRNNMPSGAVTHQTLALSAVGGAEETDAFVSAPISPSAFIPGTNIVAVEVHQNSVLSGDMSFALELVVDFVPPAAIAVEAVVPETREVSPLTDQAIVPGVFRVTRTETNGPLVVGLRLTGTASNSIDYEFVESLAVIPDGAASLDIQITALDDLLVEGTETVVLKAFPASCLACANGAVTNGGSATIRILDNEEGNTPPTVNIFQPTNGSVFPFPGYVFLQATAEDAEDEDLLRVEFFAGNTLIGEAEFYATLCPQNCPYYALGWSNMPPGSYSVTARATDNGGLTTTSSPVQITFLGTNAPGHAPRVVEQPQNLTVNVGAAATFSVTVTGSPPFTFRWQRNGITVRVTTEPSLTLSNVQSAQAGAYRVTVTNAYGLTLSSNAMLTVINTNPPPPETTFVTVVASDPQAFEPGILTVVDSGRFSIRRRGNMDTAIPVHFRLSGTASNGIDYSFVTNSVIIPAGATQAVVNINALPDNLPEGSETVVLRLEPLLCIAIYPPPPECYLIEFSGEAEVTINDGSSVSNRPPLISITTPTNGAVIPHGSPVHIAAVARDFDGYVNRVQFFANDQLIGEQTINFIVAPPPGESITFDLMWTNPPAGLVGLRARAFDDGGASAPSLPVFITVGGTNPPPNTNEIVIRFEPPSLPRGSALISNWFESGFVFWTPNRLGHSDNGVSYWSPSNGTPFLQFGATHSPLVIRRVDQQPFDLRGVDLSEYSTGFQMPKEVTFTGTRSDGSTVARTVITDGVIDGGGPLADFQSFEFGLDFSGLIRVDVSPSPYALDNLRVRSNSTTPPPTNAAPHIVMVWPVNGSGFPAGTNIFLGANVFTTSGVERVEFFANDLFLGQGSGPLPGAVAAWGLTWSNVPAQSYALRAVATDFLGRRGTSAPVNITVFPNGPVVRVVVNDSIAVETAGSIVNTGRFTFTRNGPVNTAMAVSISMSGTALNGVDYVTISNVVFFPPGASNVHVVVTPRDDDAVELTESAVITILPPPTFPGANPYLIGSPSQGAVSIHDNDTNPPPAGALIAAGSVWKYRDTGADLGTAWREPGYNDGEWPSGPAQLGFGDGDEVTVVNGGPLTNRTITTYFRHAFDVSNPAAVSNLVVRLMRDDGGVVYLNGVEVFRSNMPEGPISYFTLASMASDESVDFYSSPVDASLLVAGQNVIAVEVHQNAFTSSDLSFDLELTGAGATPVERTVVTVVASDPQASEPNSTTAINPGQFALRRTGNLGSSIQVLFSLGGSAGNGADYNFISNRVVIPAGATQAMVMVLPRMDALVEGTETVTLTIQPPLCAAVVPPPPSCYLIGSPSTATMFIGDSVSLSNHPPVVTIVRPSSGEGFEAPANILLGANATDDGIVQRLEFEANGASIGNATGPLTTPAGAWLLTWSNVPPGSYELRAVALDAFGARGTSAPVTIFVTNPPVAGQVTLVSTGAVWKYHDQGLDLGDAWRSTAYDDGNWNSGPGQLGYGDFDEATLVSGGPDPTQKNITTYFRRAFEVANASSFDSLHLRLLYDDGAVVYLNGVEVLRVNLPPGPIGYATPASTVSMENAIAEATVSAGALLPGRNVLAVEIHQINQVSSDISFDLSLTASGEELPPLPPVVELVAPSESAVFNGPTNIVLTARVSDPNGDGTVRLLEFFAGNLRIGARTNFAGSIPGGGIIAPYSFTWVNAPIGAHTLTAVATDQGGGRGTSAPVHITVQGLQEPSPDAELHVVAVYSGLYNGGSSPNHQRGDAHVVVNRPERKVVLYLSAYEPVLWHVEVEPGTVIERVFLAGYYTQEITGLPDGTPVQRVNSYVGYNLDCAGFYLSAADVRRLTGLEIASFHGSYTAMEPFVIHAVSDDPRLRSDFPRPVPANEVPALSFQLDFAARGSSDVSRRAYTLHGPISGDDLLPEMRVHADPAGRYFYGAESHEVWRIDTQAHTASQMTLPPGLPEFSWAWAGAYDTTRNRFLVSSFGGTGYLYGYSPSNEAWSVVRDLNQLDLSSIAYHAATDQIFALSLMFSECDRPVLHRLTASGEIIANVPLSILPFGRYGVRTELVSVGERLVLLMQARYENAESRIYLVNPETGAVQLTYRHVPGQDDDHDGVPNHRDLCPATPRGTIVTEQGCPVSVADTDGDGVADTVDACPGTAPDAIVNGNGCSIAQLVPCDGPWSSHSNYVQAVSGLAETFQKEGLITLTQRLAIVIDARRSLCGYQRPRLAMPVQCEDEIRTNGCRLVLSGEGPGTCVIECSVDLVHWTPISTNVLSGASIPIVDPTRSTAPRRFYRLRPEIISPLLMKSK